jgi:hypothetical protein
VVYGEIDQLAALAEELGVRGRDVLSDYVAGLSCDDF